MNTHDAWEQIHRNKNWGGYPAEHVIRFVARNYYSTERSKTRILDYGCGTGNHTWYLAREGFDTYAFDISETAIEKLRNRMEAEGVKAHVQVMDGMDLNYDTDFFDAVIDNVSIQSNMAADIKTMYRGVWKVLKIGGKFLTVVFGKNTTGYGTGKLLEPGTYEGLEKGSLQGLGCRHFFEENELRFFLEEAGFSNIVVDMIQYTDKGNTIEQLVAIGTK